MMARREMLAGAAAASIAGPSWGSDATVGLQAALDREVARGAPGLSAAIATSRGVVWTGTAGAADLSPGGARVDEAHVFGLGSITKTYLAVVLLQLAEEGRLSPLDQLTRHLGAETLAGLPNAGLVTLAQLMNHTGGVPSWEDDPEWIRDGRGDRIVPERRWGKRETLDYIRGADHRPLNPPGAAFSYANTNHTLLGLVVESVTGQPAEAEIRRRVLEPLGLRDTWLEGFEADRPDRQPRRYHHATPAFRRDAGVSPHFPAVRPGLIDVSTSNLSVEWTAGGMVATARDLATYAVALRDGRLFGSDSARFVRTWTPIAGGDGTAEVGHGLFREARPGIGVTLGHAGDVLGFSAAVWWLEDGDAVIATLANVGTMHSGPVQGHGRSPELDADFGRLAVAYAAGR